MPFFYYYDPYYWMILVPAMLIALLAQLNVSSTFNRYSRMASPPGLYRQGAPPSTVTPVGPAAGALPAPRRRKQYCGPTAFKMCALSGSPAG